MQPRTCPLTCGLSTQTSEEVLEKMTGLLVPMVDQRNATMTFNNSVQKLPRSLDYRKKGIVTAVKNQVRLFFSSQQRMGVNKRCVSMTTDQSGQRP